MLQNIRKKAYGTYEIEDGRTHTLSVLDKEIQKNQSELHLELAKQPQTQAKLYTKQAEIIEVLANNLQASCTSHEKRETAIIKREVNVVFGFIAASLIFGGISQLSQEPGSRYSFLSLCILSFFLSSYRAFNMPEPKPNNELGLLANTLVSVVGFFKQSNQHTNRTIVNGNNVKFEEVLDQENENLPKMLKY